MTAERWKQVEELFFQAAEMPPAARDAWLESACGGDEELKREVRDLRVRVKPEHYALVLEALLWAFGQALQPRFYPETKAAWKAVLDDIVKEMLAWT